MGRMVMRDGVGSCTKRSASAVFWLGVGLQALLGCGGSTGGDPKATGGAGVSEQGGSSGMLGSSGATSSGGDAPTEGGSSSTGGRTSIAPPHPTDQVDILLMLDNSISMGEKQAILADSLPSLLSRLVTPACLDERGSRVATQPLDGSCPPGSSPELNAVKDIHIGVVTSSLGAHGGQTCAAPEADDKGQLIGKLRPDPTYATWNDSGFLAWDPEQNLTPPGDGDPAVLSRSLENMILSANQVGCGYEASLEAWYRFLIDPEPPTDIPMVRDPSQPTMPVYSSDPKRNPVLVQRAAFLRPDSALVILMLTDENDCSIRDEGQGWIVGLQTLGGTTFRMPGATAICAVNPNDKCCLSCAQGVFPPECANPASDVACRAGGNLSAVDDNLGLRCWDHKRRFGYDFLYPVSRYVDGLTQSWVPSASDTSMVPNPLFPPGGRTPSMVFLAGIVGVPWQDLATMESLPDEAELRYLSHSELTAQGRWPLVLGDPGDADHAPTGPGDKLMFETTSDRTVLFDAVPHPLLGSAAALAPATASGRPNPINGHETNIADNSELQYACIFPLPQPKDCAEGSETCDCKASDAPFNRALCDGTTQTHAKAYPSVRELRVLKSFGDLTGNAITTSICPKTLDVKSSPSYGYHPAIDALVGRLKSELGP
jgi:hypothetical protein